MALSTCTQGKLQKYCVFPGTGFVPVGKQSPWSFSHLFSNEVVRLSVCSWRVNVYTEILPEPKHCVTAISLCVYGWNVYGAILKQFPKTSSYTVHYMYITNDLVSTCDFVENPSPLMLLSIHTSPVRTHIQSDIICPELSNVVIISVGKMMCTSSNRTLPITIKQWVRCVNHAAMVFCK